MKKLVFVLLFLTCASLVVFAIDYFSYLEKSSFHPSHIRTSLLKGEKNLGLTKETDAVFEKPFHYIGEGAECFAFQSSDHAYVLKLFKREHLRYKNWLKEGFIAQLFGFHRLKNAHKKKESRSRWESKFLHSVARYEKAYLRLPEETGLLALHFYPDASASAKPVRITSKWGKFYTLDLEQVPFILQKRAELVPQRISSLLKRKERAKAKEAVTKLRQLLMSRTEKGLTDARQCFSINFGFYGETPMQIDVGKLEELKGDKETEKRRLEANLDAWVKKHFPGL